MSQYKNTNKQIITSKPFSASLSSTILFVYLVLYSLIPCVDSVLIIDSLQISAVTNYTLQVSEFTSIAPSGSLIQLQLPSQYSADDLHGRIPYGGQMYDGFCPVDCSAVGVAYSGYIFNVTGMFPNDDLLAFQYTITNVPNPRIAATVTGYIIRVIDPSQNIIYSENVANKIFTPKPMSCSGTAIDFNAVNFISTAYFTINPLTNPSDYPVALMMLEFPSIWSGQPILTSTITTDLYCLSSSQPQITCQRSSQLINVLNVSYSASIDLQIHSIVSASSMMGAGLVTISTMTSSRVKIDSCSINITGLTQDYLRLSTMTISYPSNTQLNISVSTTFPSRVASGTTVQFTFPANLPMSSATCQAYLAGTLLGSVIPTYIPSNNTIRIIPFTSLIFKPNIELQCVDVNRPRNAFLVSNISVSSYYSGFMVAGISCCSTLLKPRASLDVSSIVTDKPYLQTSNCQYFFTFTTTMSVLTTDLMYIYFPHQYSLGTGTKPCSISSITASTGTPTCTILNGNLIMVASFLTSDAVTPATFELIITSIQNPVQNPSFTPFQLYIVNSARQTIEYNSTQTVTISAATINTFSVTAANLQVLYSPAQYVVQFTTNGLISTNYYVIVKLPVEVGVTLSALSCYIGAQAYPCWYTSSQNSIQVRITSNLASTSVTLTINGCINPQSLSPTQKFTLQILDSSQNIIQISSILLSVTVTMNATQQFKNIYLNFNTSSTIFPTIHSTNILQIVAVALSTVKSTHKIVISYNASEILFNAASSSSTCNSPIVCVVNTTTKIINVLNIASTPNTDTVYLNISNTIALVPKPTLTIQLRTTSNYLILSQSVTNSPTLPDLITYNLTQSTWQFSTSADITIDYSLAALSASSPSLSTLTGLSYMLVYVPNQYTTFVTANIYNITTLNGQISIPGIINPSYAQYTSSVYYIAGYNTNSQLIAISIVNKKFSPTCSMPCRTCVSPSLTNCINCYSWHTLNILYTNSSSNLTTCVSNCPRYYYQDNITMSCQKCNVNCLQCDAYTPTKCLSCISSQYLHEVDYVCYTVCPSGYYKSNGSVCRICTNNCLTCLNQTYCYTCASGIYLYNNLCISACPPTTYQVLSPLTCINCPTPNCLQCNQSQCLTCASPYYLYNKQCFLVCPAPLFPTISHFCKNCECAACSNYASNCTLCSLAAPYMYNNYCYTACPKGMYSGASNICTSCPFSCVTCTNFAVCTLCKETYAIMSYSVTNVSCISASSCPVGTILTLSPTDIPMCSACTSPCATCSITTTFCLTCITSYNFHNNTCVLTCPSPYHPISSVCQKCIAVCLLCIPTDPQNCTQCQPNYFLFNNTCYTSCPIGTYTDVSNKQCASCNPSCRTCSNSTNCTSCNTGKFLYNWLCYSNCPTSPVLYYQYNGACTQCQPQCTTCINSSPVACASCSNSNYIYNQVTFECVFQCVLPYYRNNSFCISCQSPCATCDTTFNACSSCLNGLYVYNGSCLSQCPSGFFGNSTTKYCQTCIYPCRICLENQCLLCQSFSYIYKKSCVLVCPDDMPYEQPGYCSQCVGIGFCARCGSSTTTNTQICTQCVYPYVLFEQTCLNSCPTNYTAIESQSGGRQCTKSSQYLQYLSQKQSYNKPILPPFLILGLYLLLILIISIISHKIYRFTYHVGFMIGFLTLFDAIFIYYNMYFVYTRYEGQYVPVVPILPFALLSSGLIFNSLLLTFIFWFLVLRNIYLTDLRYQQWKSRNTTYWWISTIAMLILGGPRLHKLNYSKMFGFDIFAYRIVSVQKFYEEDVLTYLSGIGDFLQLCAGFICVYNNFITYNGLLFFGYQTFGIKLILWILLLYDLKKPDRGFFIGDEEQAQIQIMKQLEQQIKNLNRIDTQNFVKLVRTKSAQLIRNPKYFGDLDVEDFISVYNPDDYQEVIKVPNRKIQKNIYRGKYRKGKKITVQQKINKYADIIKPKPVLKKEKSDDAYLWKMIYWKPPDFKKQKPKQTVLPSQHSMLALLQQKQMEYKQDLDDIELVQDEKNQRKYFVKPRYNQRTFLDDLDETIPNETVQFFYPAHSIDTHQKQASIDFDDLMNLNYARRKHLQKQQEQELKIESKRKLHHQPHKKRRDLKGIGQRILQNQF